MLASSSRITLNTALKKCPASRPAFSTCNVIRAKRQIMVELLQDVEGLGTAYEKVSVSPGRMRNTLVTARQARYIPWKRPSDKERSSAPSPFSSHLYESTSSPSVVAEIFSSLPPRLVFQLRTTSPSASSVHGSVTLADIAHRLEQEHAVSSGDVEVSWLEQDDAERMKELGVWDVLVKSKGLEGLEAEIEVELARLDE